MTPDCEALKSGIVAEMRRLHARPIDGGPHVVHREGAILVWGSFLQIEATPAMLANLKTLPDGAGLHAMWEAMK